MKIKKEYLPARAEQSNGFFTYRDKSNIDDLFYRQGEDWIRFYVTNDGTISGVSTNPPNTLADLVPAHLTVQEDILIVRVLH